MGSTDILVDILFATATFAFSAWRIPFAHKSRSISIFFGASLLCAYVANGLVAWLLTGTPRYFFGATVLAAAGFGFVAHACVVALFAKRLS